MRAKRRFDRFLVQREAKYFSQGGLGNWQECTISNVSRKGMKILFHERINVGSTICLDIPDPGFSIYGIVKWIEERGNDFIGGIELTKMLDDEKLSKLLTSSRLFHKKISTNIIKEATEDMKAHEKETISPSPFIPNQHFILSSFKKVFSSKSISVSLLLLLSLLFLFLMGRGYFSRNLINEGNQKKDMVLQLKEVSSSIEPTETVSDQLVSPADAHLVTQNEPAVSREKDDPIAVLKLEGGSLCFLALKHYQRANETLFDLILKANPHITDVRQIDDDQKITLPVITPESYIEKGYDGMYRVHVGTFESPEVASLYYNKVSGLEKILNLDSHKFSPEDTWYRLMISFFTSKEEALKTVNLLSEQGIIYIPPEVLP